MTDYVTVRGFVATKPDPRVLPDGSALTSFRLASTPRWYDTQAREWKDGHTNWFTVACFRGLAGNVASSVDVGQPVLVQGKLKIKNWESEGVRRTSVEIEATSVGLDLAFGTARFARHGTKRNHDREGSAPEEATSGWDQAPGVPPEHAGHVPAGVNAHTGEIDESAEASGEYSGDSSEAEEAVLAMR